MGNVANIEQNKGTKLKDIETLKDEVKGRLKEYLEHKGIKFQKKNQFHCFNSSAHNHGDKDASASLYKDTNFKCFACGVSGDIFTACNMIEGKPIEGKEFFDTLKHLCDVVGVSYQEESFKSKPAAKKAPVKNLVAEYMYLDANNQPRYKVNRFEWHEDGERKKELIPMRFEDGKWLTGYKDVERILYRLPDVNEAIKKGQPVFFVEGEKCVEIIRKLGLTATTICGGSNAWIKPHTLNYIQELIRANLIILPDNDKAGKKFGELVASEVSALVNSVKVVELQGLPPKGDIEQWLQLGGTKEKLLELVMSTKEWTKQEKVQQQQKSVYINNNCYYKICKDYDKKISNFIIEPVECIQCEGKHEYIARAKTDSGQVIDFNFTLETFTNKGNFKKVFMHPALSYTGNDDDLQDIKVIFGSMEHDMKDGVKCIGFHKDKDGNELFVSDKKAVNAYGDEMRNIVLMSAYKEITTNILEVSPITKDEIKSILKPIFSYNTLEKTSTIMGFIMGCFLKEKLWANNIKLNHLVIEGESGSGKSQTVENILMPLLSTESKFSAGSITPFVILKNASSSNAIPYIIDEYKPREIGEYRVKQVSELLRNAYDRNKGARGTQSQTINEYEPIAPIVLIGEEGISETANRERILAVLFAKKDIKSIEYKNSLLILKKYKNLVKKLGRAMLEKSMKTPTEYVGELHIKLLQKLYSNKSANFMPERMQNSIANAMLGLTLFDDMLREEYQINLQAATGYSTEDMMNVIIKAVFDNLLDGSLHSKSAVDNTIEIMDRMAGAERIRKGEGFQVIKNGEELALDVKRIYDELTKYVREHDIKSEVLPYQQFTKQLRKTSYYKDYKIVEFKFTTYGGVTKSYKRAFILNLEQLKTEIDIENLIK